jgi:GT2 family glycosyltransferase
MSKKPSVAVGICTKNRKESLVKCLTSLRGEMKLINKIIVVEDVSDGQFFDLQSLKKVIDFRHVECIYKPVKYCNIAKSRQEIIDAVHQGILIFSDDDIVIEKNTIKKTIQFFLDKPDASFVRGPVLPSNIKNVVAHIDYVFCSQGVIGLKKRTLINPCPFPFGAFNISFLKRNRITDQPSFDPQFPKGEDMDFCLNLHLKGHHLYFDPDIIAYHRYDLNPFRYLKKKFSQGKYMYGIYRKYGSFSGVSKSIPNFYGMLFFPAFIILRAWRLTKYYSEIYSFSFVQLCFIFIAEMTALLSITVESFISPLVY